jgi:hypothetical protein
MVWEQEVGGPANRWTSNQFQSEWQDQQICIVAGTRSPKRKSLYPNLSQYAANRAQTVQCEPNRVLNCQQLTREPERNHPFAKPFRRSGKPPTRVRIPPSPPSLSQIFCGAYASFSDP